MGHLIGCIVSRGEGVIDFIAAVEHHAKVRQLSQDEGWWVCA